VKDNYRTLGIHPKASVEDIKRAYRSLARAHHPETDPDNPYANARFREIADAYAVLSNPSRRRQYDEERWLRGLFPHDRRGPVTPDTLLRDAHKLQAHIRTVDRGHMNHAALRDLILFLLSDEHLSILRHSDAGRSAQLSESLLETARVLQPRAFADVAVRLALINPTDEVMLRRIYAIGRERQQQAWWERWTPLFIVLGVVLLCVLMVLTSQRH